jgi:hypothetical protein
VPQATSDFGVSRITSSETRPDGSKLDHVIDVLGDKFHLLNLVRASMAVLRMLCQRRASLIRLQHQSRWLFEETLFFGNFPIAGNDTLVDRVKEMMGGTATIFAKRGDAFVRISTNVLTRRARAVGTVLDPDGPAISAIQRGEPFTRWDILQTVHYRL